MRDRELECNEPQKNYLFSILLLIVVNIISFFYATWNYVSSANYDFLNTIICIISCFYIIKKRQIVLFITKKDFWALLFSIVFSSALMIGKAIYYTSLSIETNSWSIVVFLSDIILCFVYIKILFYQINKIKVSNFDSVICNWMFSSITKTTLLIMLFWLPIYLAYYPGAFCYDAWCQLNWELSKFHPVLHTFFMEICIYLGAIISDNVGIVVYALAQMTLCALAFSYIVNYFYKKGYKILSVISFLFYAINPVIVLFSFLTTKDILCGASFLVFILYLHMYIKEKENRIIIPIILFGVICCLLRNNMIHAVLVSSIIYSLLYKREKIFRLFIAIICCFFIVNNVIYPLIGVKEGDEKEKLCVPIQQISYVYNEEYDNLSQEEKEKIEFFLPGGNIESFNFRNADVMKASFDTEKYLNNKSAFWDYYIDFLLKYPKDYLVSFLNLNIPYWYQYAKTIDDLSQLPYIEEQLFYVNDDITPVRIYKFPIIYKVYHEFASYKIPSKMSFLYVFTAINIPIWLMLLSLFYCLYYAKRNELSIVILPLLFMLTFLFGPYSNMRYIIPVYFMYPLFIFTFIVQPEK